MARCNVKTWNKHYLLAAGMSVGKCESDEPSTLIGIDMVAQDGNTFAHGHFPIETAIQFYENLGQAIADAQRTELN